MDIQIQPGVRGSQMEKPQHPLEVHHVYIELNREPRLLLNKQVGLLYILRYIVYHNRSNLSRGATSVGGCKHPAGGAMTDTFCTQSQHSH